MNSWRSLVGEDGGQDLVEYALAIALIAIAAIAALTALGGSANATFEHSGDVMREGTGG